MNANGWPCCMSTAPTLVAHASVSMVNGVEKLGRANIGAEDSADFSVVFFFEGHPEGRESPT